MLKKTVMAGVVAAAFLPGFVAAAEQAPASPHTITGNVGVFSQYIFRGLTQTDRHPALQGGFDYSHSSGFYAGTWGSNISWLKENFSSPGAPAGTYGEGGSLELDFYGGYKGTFGKSDFTYDVGTLYYWYPGKINPVASAFFAPFEVPKADTWELYGALGWKWISGKVSYSLMNKTFGTKDSSGTWYLDLSANVPLGDFSKGLDGWTFMAHWGYQKYKGTDPRNVFFAGAYGGVTPDNDELLSYKDIKIGLSYALPKDFTIGAYYTKAYDTNVLGYGGTGDVFRPGFVGPYPRDIGKGTGTIYVQKTF